MTTPSRGLLPVLVWRCDARSAFHTGGDFHPPPLSRRGLTVVLVGDNSHLKLCVLLYRESVTSPFGRTGPLEKIILFGSTGTLPCASNTDVTGSYFLCFGLYRWFLRTGCFFLFHPWWLA